MEVAPDTWSEDQQPDLPAARTLPVDLETIVEIATEDEFYPDDSYERTGYVDTHTGAVHVIYLASFRCAGGDLEPDQLEMWTVEDVELARQIRADTEGRYEEIERWRSSESYALMEAFVERTPDPRVRERLAYALQGKKPFRRFKDALLEWPPVRDAWFAFQGHEQRECARVWLRNFGIEAEDASSYKLPPKPERW